jgi:hypothetical protein
MGGIKCGDSQKTQSLVVQDSYGWAWLGSDSTEDEK